MLFRSILPLIPLSLLIKVFDLANEMCIGKLSTEKPAAARVFDSEVWGKLGVFIFFVFCFLTSLILAHAL